MDVTRDNTASGLRFQQRLSRDEDNMAVIIQIIVVVIEVAFVIIQIWWESSRFRGKYSIARLASEMHGI